MTDLVSRYGAAFDRVARQWADLENLHDEQHPDRSKCGGVGSCSMRFAAVTLEHRMIDALQEWRAS